MPITVNSVTLTRAFQNGRPRSTPYARLSAVRTAWAPEDAAQIVAMMPIASSALLRWPSTSSTAGASASATTGGAYSMMRSASPAAAPGWPMNPAAADRNSSSGNIASTDEKATLPAWLAL